MLPTSGATTLVVQRVFSKCWWSVGFGLPNHSTRTGPSFSRPFKGDGSKSYRYWNTSKQEYCLPMTILPGEIVYCGWLTVLEFTTWIWSTKPRRMHVVPDAFEKGFQSETDYWSMMRSRTLPTSGLTALPHCCGMSFLEFESLEVHRVHWTVKRACSWLQPVAFPVETGCWKTYTELCLPAEHFCIWSGNSFEWIPNNRMELIIDEIANAPNVRPHCSCLLLRSEFSPNLDGVLVCWIWYAVSFHMHQVLCDLAWKMISNRFVTEASSADFTVYQARLFSVIK